eukprot:4888447-Pleurochrysis_carterae.AAC.1
MGFQLRIPDNQYRLNVIISCRHKNPEVRTRMYATRRAGVRRLRLYQLLGIAQENAIERRSGALGFQQGQLDRLPKLVNYPSGGGAAMDPCCGVASLLAQVIRPTMSRWPWGACPPPSIGDGVPRSTRRPHTRTTYIPTTRHVASSRARTGRALLCTPHDGERAHEREVLPSHHHPQRLLFL